MKESCFNLGTEGIGLFLYERKLKEIDMIGMTIWHGKHGAFGKESYGLASFCDRHG